MTLMTEGCAKLPNMSIHPKLSRTPTLLYLPTPLGKYPFGEIWIGYYISQLFILITKYPRQSSFKEKRFTGGCSFGGSSRFFFGPIDLILRCDNTLRWMCEAKQRQRTDPIGLSISYKTSSCRLHCLLIMSPWNQAFIISLLSLFYSLQVAQSGWL